MHRRFVSAVLLVLVAVAAVPVFASHAWSSYHWRRTTAQITPPVHNNVNSTWKPYLDRAVADWNLSIYIQSPYGSAYGPITSRTSCASATGRIEVCNASYGQNGWLGIAGISLSGGHIAKGYTKLNDTYFNTAQYNTPAWRRMVTCQEVGHDYGLGHVNEVFTNLNTGSCMDYTNDPTGTLGTNGTLSNQYPNAHDYAMLEAIYAHIDAPATTLPFDAITSDATRPRKLEEFMNKAEQYGTPVAFDPEGRPTVFYLAIPNIGTNHGGEDHGPVIDGQLTDILWAPIDPFENDRGQRGGRDQ
jgi:hypothetical protein